TRLVDRSPDELRNGVRQGIFDALAVDLDRTSSVTATRLGLAGILGLAGAVGSVVLFSGNALHQGHGWHLALCAAAWAGLLVECFAVVLLRIRPRRLPLGQAAALALLGLGLAAVLGLICPDPRYLDWWTGTALGATFMTHAGISGSALCLGLCSALVIGIGAALILTLRGIGFRSIHLPAAFLFLLLWPAVVLQSAGAPLATFASWSVGLAIGAYAGVFLGLLPARLSREAAEGTGG
ncbi:MAG: hypothetical protein ACREKH_19195, partial [Candidatus Rokuibacteriota bacterium]